MNEKRRGDIASVGEILAEKTIIFTGADAFTEKGFTQVPNAILRSKKISPGGTADNIRIVCWAANMLLGTWGDKPAMKVATGIARRGGR